MTVSDKVQELTHVNEAGEVHMVDVGNKAVTRRVAVAVAVVVMEPATLQKIQSDGLPKGDVLATVRLAAIMGTKRCADLIPLCHPIPIDGVKVDVSVEAEFNRIRITVEVHTTGKTGIEMEALTGASVGALTLYDMCKAVDRGMVIQTVQLLQKSGGKSGDWQRNTA